MSQRIRQLEDALALLQSRVSSEKHSLLRDDLLSIKYGPEMRSLAETEPSLDDPLTGTVDAFGTLSIDDRGAARYFGVSAGLEVRSISTPENSIFTNIELSWHIDLVVGTPHCSYSLSFLVNIFLV